MDNETSNMDNKIIHVDLNKTTLFLQKSNETLKLPIHGLRTHGSGKFDSKFAEYHFKGKSNATVLKILTIFFLVWFGTHTVLITIDGLRDNIQKADAGIVLGNKVETGGKPSNRLKARLDKTIELYRKGFLKYIIVSGGIGKEGFDEAEVMKKFEYFTTLPPKKGTA